MPVSTAIVVAAFILGFTAIAMTIFLAGRKRQAQDDEMRQAASARGWTFDSRFTRGKRIHTWTGSTDGIAWRAEMIQATSKHDGPQHQQYVSRWHGEFSPGISKPIFLIGVPKGKEVPAFTIAEGDGLIAKLAQKAAGFALDKGIDIYFGDDAGKEVEAASLHRVVTGLPGFIVMAADKEEGTRVLSQGLEAALVAAIDDKASVFAATERPSILLRPHGLSIARMERFADVNDLDHFVRAGVALTRTFIFGRRSLS